MIIAAAQNQDFTILQRSLAILAALIIAVTAIELIRRRKLREEYAMLWIGSSAILLVFAAFPGLLWWISEVTGVFYLTVLMMMIFSFLCLVIIHLSVVISRLSADNCRIVQKLASLEEKLESMKKKD